MPKSLFAEARSALLTEPTHMEDEDEDQENEKEDGETVKSAKWSVEEKSEQTLRLSMDDMMRTNILSQCHVRH